MTTGLAAKRRFLVLGVLALVACQQPSGWLDPADRSSVESSPFVGAYQEALPDGISKDFQTRPLLHAIVGTQYLYDVAVNRQAEGSEVTVVYSLPEAPLGMQVESASGRVTWTPTRDQSGPQRVVLKADVAGRVKEQIFAVQVAWTEPVVVGLVGVPFAVTGTGTGLDGAQLLIEPAEAIALGERRWQPNPGPVTLSIVKGSGQMGPKNLKPWTPRFKLDGAPPGSKFEISWPDVVTEDGEILLAVAYSTDSEAAGVHGTGDGSVMLMETRREEDRVVLQGEIDDGTAVYEVSRGWVYSRESPTARLFWLLAPEEEPPVEIVDDILSALDRSRATMAGELGCQVPDQIRVFVAEFSGGQAGTGGYVKFGETTIVLEKAAAAERYPDDSMDSILAHEYSHVVQNTLFVARGRRTVTRWILESTAVYIEDQVFDNNAYVRRYQGETKYQEWSALVGPRLGLGSSTYLYQLVAFLKHLQKVEGFSTCGFLAETLHLLPEPKDIDHLELAQVLGHEALDAYLGGKLVERYASFLAAYSVERLRRERFIDDVILLPLSGLTPKSVDANPDALGRVYANLVAGYTEKIVFGDTVFPFLLRMVGPSPGDRVFVVDDDPTAPIAELTYEDPEVTLLSGDELLESGELVLTYLNEDLLLVTVANVELVPLTEVTGTVVDMNGDAVGPGVVSVTLGEDEVIAGEGGRFTFPLIPIDEVASIAASCVGGSGSENVSLPGLWDPVTPTEVGSIELDGVCQEPCGVGFSSTEFGMNIDERGNGPTGIFATMVLDDPAIPDYPVNYVKVSLSGAWKPEYRPCPGTFGQMIYWGEAYGSDYNGLWQTYVPAYDETVSGTGCFNAAYWVDDSTFVAPLALGIPDSADDIAGVEDVNTYFHWDSWCDRVSLDAR